MSARTAASTLPPLTMQMLRPPRARAAASANAPAPSATIAYLESLGGMEVLCAYEHELGAHFLQSLPAGVTVYGLQTLEGRLPTFLLNVEGVEAADAARELAGRGYGVWAHDTWYSLGLREKLPYPRDAIRVGLIHYNTVEEIDGFVAELGRLAG